MCCRRSSEIPIWGGFRSSCRPPRRPRRMSRGRTVCMRIATSPNRSISTSFAGPCEFWPNFGSRSRNFQMEEPMENQISVLLIEDNPGDTRLMQELFREAKGISVCLLCADRLSSGLKQISDGGVDIVLLDLSLPDSKGFDTFTKLHAQ